MLCSCLVDAKQQQKLIFWESYVKTAKNHENTIINLIQIKKIASIGGDTGRAREWTHVQHNEYIYYTEKK
jgi:hypothetical protein